MERKQFLTQSVKSITEKGEGRAVIATLNVIDKDGDVTIPGAFGEQSAVVIPVHDWDHIPIGKTSIREVDNEVVADFKLNIDSVAGKEWHSALKFDLANDPPLQEWSYGFNIEDHNFGEFIGQQVRFLKKMKVHEISPVLLGAGVNTRTVAIKGSTDIKSAIAAHETNTDTGEWDGPANEAQARSGESITYYSDIFAWYDEDGDRGVKSTYKFIHHFVSANGTPGAASTRACTVGIGVLNGGMGGTTIPEADRVGVWRHLAKHLKDAGIDPPELKGLNNGMKLADHIDSVIVSARGLVSRVRGVKEMREREGRKLSPDRLVTLATAKDEFLQVIKEIDEMCSVSESVSSDLLFKALMEFERIKHENFIKNRY